MNRTGHLVRSAVVAGLSLTMLATGVATSSSATTRQPKTLSAAVAAARADSCATCVHLTYSRSSARASASRGLVELSETDPQGGGAVILWGYTGTRWRQLAGYQDDVPLPNRLPMRIWVCTDDRATRIRSGPGTNYRVLRTVRDDTRVRATRFRLTKPATPPRNGAGWFRVTVHGRTGWVSSTRVANDLGCGFWRMFGDLNG